MVAATAERVKLMSEWRKALGTRTAGLLGNPAEVNGADVGPALSIGHSLVHKRNQQQSNHNQDHPHNRPNNQTGHIGKGAGSMIAYYHYLSGYPQDYR
jgi:hypothetical protein